MNNSCALNTRETLAHEHESNSPRISAKRSAALFLTRQLGSQSKFGWCAQVGGGAWGWGQQSTAVTEREWHMIQGWDVSHLGWAVRKQSLSIMFCSRHTLPCIWGVMLRIEIQSLWQFKNYAPCHTPNTSRQSCHCMKAFVLLVFCFCLVSG